MKTNLETVQEAERAFERACEAWSTVMAAADSRSQEEVAAQGMLLAIEKASSALNDLWQEIQAGLDPTGSMAVVAKALREVAVDVEYFWSPPWDSSDDSNSTRARAATLCAMTSAYGALEQLVRLYGGASAE